MTPTKQQAIQHALAGDWENAISINESLLIEYPQDIETLNRLAYAYTITGNMKKAKQTYRRVLDIDTLNPIALRNMKRLNKAAVSVKRGTVDIHGVHASNMFLEENGKTKVIELMNIAPLKVTATLRTGQVVMLSIKRSKIFVLDEEKQYIGMLPEDLGNRLIKFMNGGNTYEAYVKSSDEKKVIIFVKETKRTTRYKDQPSFLTYDSHLSFEKNSSKTKNEKKEEADQESIEDES